MNEERPTTYIIDLSMYDNPTSGTYFEIPLPDEIQKLEGLQPVLEELEELEESGVTGQELRNEKSKAFFPELVTHEEMPSYLRYNLNRNESDGRFSYVLKNQGSVDEPDFRVGVPKEFLRGDSLFSDLGSSDSIKIEVDVATDELRIYREENYWKRDQELADQGRKPVVKKYPAAAIATQFTDRYVNLSGGYEGQKFRIIPFDVMDGRFLEGLTGKVDSETFDPGPEKIEQAIQEGEMPQYSVEKVEILWNRAQPSFKFREDQSQVIYTEYITDAVQVILPSRGSFRITTTTQYGTRSSSLVCRNRGLDPENSSLDGDWSGLYTTNPADKEYSTKYVPCVTS